MSIEFIVLIFCPCGVPHIPLETSELLIRPHTEFYVPLMFDTISFHLLWPIIWDLSFPPSQLPCPKGESNLGFLIPIQIVVPRAIFKP